MSINQTNVDRFLKALGDGKGEPGGEERAAEEYRNFVARKSAQLARAKAQKGITRKDP